MKLPKWLVVLLSVFAVASGLLILAGILLGESWDLQGQATAYHVVDGNTLELDVDGQRIRMDLALVDPPPPDSYHGQKAIEFLKKKVQQFRQDGHDDHFFYLKKTKNGYAGEILYGTQTTSLNEDLIKEGLARVVIPPKRGLDGRKNRRIPHRPKGSSTSQAGHLGPQRICNQEWIRLRNRQTDSPGTRGRQASRPTGSRSPKKTADRRGKSVPPPDRTGAGQSETERRTDRLHSVSGRPLGTGR